MSCIAFGYKSTLSGHVIGRSRRIKTKPVARLSMVWTWLEGAARNVIYGLVPWQTDYDVSLTFGVGSTPTAVSCCNRRHVHLTARWYRQRRKPRSGNLGETRSNRRIHPILRMPSHWRRQLWGTGARAPSTSHCLIFLVTSEPHKLRLYGLYPEARTDITGL